jgi:predicted transcriptional regulator
VSATFTIRLDDEKAAALKQMAADENLTPEEIIASALDAWIELSDDDLAAVREGLADSEAGRTVPHDEVERWLQTWGKGSKTTPPKCPD